MAIDVERFYVRYGPMVLRRCRKLLRSDAQAEDALQDVFVQLLRYEDALEAQAPSALLLRIATNTCLNRLRSTRRRPETPDDELLMRIAATGGDVEERAAARGLLGRLFGGEPERGPSTQAIAVMHLVDGLTLEEVATESGLSVSGVRKRLRTLRARLETIDARVEGA